MILIVPILFFLAYVFGQTRTFLRLAMLLRRPGAIMPSSLAVSCLVNLGVAPGLMLLLSIVVQFLNPSKDDPLMLMTFSPYGWGFSLCCWTFVGLWFSLILPRPQTLYRGAMSVVPMVVMALICLTYSAGVGWMAAREFLLSGGVFGGGGGNPTVLLLVMFYVPTAPLPGLVLLIIHVWRMLPSDGRTGSGEDN